MSSYNIHNLPKYNPPHSFVILSIYDIENLPKKTFHPSEALLLDNHSRYTPLMLKAVQKALKEITYEQLLERLAAAEIKAFQYTKQWHELATWLYFYGYHEASQSLYSIPRDIQSDPNINYKELPLHATELANIAHYVYLKDKRNLVMEKTLPTPLFPETHTLFPNNYKFKSISPIFDAIVKTRYSNYPSDFLYTCYIDSLYPDSYFNKTSSNQMVQLYNHSLYLMSLNLQMQNETDLMNYAQNADFRKQRLGDFLSDFKQLPELKKVHDINFKMDDITTLHTKIEMLLDSNIPYTDWEDMIALPYEWIERIISDR